MKSKFTHMEIDGKEYKTLKVFTCAVIPLRKEKKEYDEYCGLNIGIVVPCGDDSVEIYKKFNIRRETVEGQNFVYVDNIQAILCSSDGLRIPAEIHTSSPYSPSYDYGFDEPTDCYFSYMHPNYFDKMGR